jgi:uncharacterized alkaline shock family protein YloU
MTERRGKTTIAPDALITIARLATLAVPGVAGMSGIPGGVNRWLKRGAADGVQIEVADNVVTADVHIVVKADQNVREVGRCVQTEVARALEEMVGLDVSAVNVTIDDVQYAEAKQSE